jgi:hypothetical protein
MAGPRIGHPRVLGALPGEQDRDRR